MNWSDPTIVGSMIGVAGGLVGVVIGGWVAKGAFRTEYRFRKRNALRAVMIELIRNQPTLDLDLDRILPAWLAHDFVGPGGEAKTKALLAQAAYLDRAAYDALFAEVIASEFGSELMSYYRKIAWLNEHIPADQRIDAEHDLGDYVRALAKAILLANDLVPALDQETRRARLKPWGRNLDVESFTASRHASEFAARLSKWGYLTIRGFFDTGEKPAGFDPILVKDRDRLEGFLLATQKF